MSWDRRDFDKTSTCACGKGRVIAYCWSADDDWNRYEEGVYGYDIQCPYCKLNYHVESITQYYSCYRWIADGIDKSTYLVPNNMRIPEVISKASFCLTTADEEIVSRFTCDELQHCIKDMTENKYSTRVALSESKAIIKICSKRMKTKSIKRILPLLQDVVTKYDSYKWNPLTISEYRKTEEERIKENERMIEETLAKSYLLRFE